MRSSFLHSRFFLKVIIYLTLIFSIGFIFNSCKKETRKEPVPENLEFVTKKKITTEFVPLYCEDLANPCSDPACAPYYNCLPEVSITPIQNASVITSFQELNVNFVQLSYELGLSYTLSSNDIDFQNLSRSYITNDTEVGEAIVAPFKNNSSSNTTNYAFCITVDDTYEYKPFIIKATTNQSLKYFDLDEGYILTVNNYNNSSTLSFQTTFGNYLNTSGPVSRVAGCGQAVMNCINDAYSNHG